MRLGRGLRGTTRVGGFSGQWAVVQQEVEAAIGLLANLKQTHKVKGAYRVEATSIMTVVKE